MAESELIEKLCRIGDSRGRRDFLRSNRTLRDAVVVEKLCEEALRQTRADLQQAERLAQAACWIGRSLKNDHCRALGLRAMGHVLYGRARYKQALQRYRTAIALLRNLGRELEVARTLSSALQSLIYLGRYREALAWAEEARRIFVAHGDRLRLARLDHNTANILYRQDRFEEALELYRGAREVLQASGGTQDVAAVLSNMAVCCISLNDFAQALQHYTDARDYCVAHGMPLLVAEADYNIAYLHYLRGEYAAAIELYQATRQHCQELGDPYHQALCDLDQSEMYLELNLSEDGAHLAQLAFDRFRQLGMGYETAKAMAHLAIAAGNQGKTDSALKLFDDARQRFVREQNRVWPALIDLYKALVLYRDERWADARLLCRSAFAFFSRSALQSKAALCELLLARLHLQARELSPALRRCGAALRRLEKAETPALVHQAWFVMGQVQEALGRREAAYQAYRKSHARLEDLRSQVRSDELKIAFLQDKLAVYESLVWMCLPGGETEQQDAFAYIEQAKSRSLADLIAFRAETLPSRVAGSGELAGCARRLRRELNWCYHEVGLRETRADRQALQSVEALRRRARQCEAQLATTFLNLRASDKEFSALQSAGTIDLEAIRASLPPDALLLEYYQARGAIYACVTGSKRLNIQPVAGIARVRELFRLLQFQLSKFRLGPEYLNTFGPRLHAATEAHLRDLYTELLAPIRAQLDAARLIVVPHDFLHYLPFHALHDGQQYMADEYSISYAPSASVYYLCCAKRATSEQQTLVLGIPDERTPCIGQEVHAVACALPNAKVFLGSDASQEPLRKYGPNSRYIHIATHGLFRQDNPMFSSIRLGNSQLTLFDLYQLNLGSELVTLSGCGTGLNVVVGGDELLGLVRGLLYAGARAVLVTLWDVNDQSTAEFMKAFYGHLRAGADKAVAVQWAMGDLRSQYAHPYYWAPFVLIGATDGTIPPICGVDVPPQAADTEREP